MLQSPSDLEGSSIWYLGTVSILILALFMSQISLERYEFRDWQVQYTYASQRDRSLLPCKDVKTILSDTSSLLPTMHTKNKLLEYEFQENIGLFPFYKSEKSSTFKFTKRWINKISCCSLFSLKRFYLEMCCYLPKKLYKRVNSKYWESWQFLSHAEFHKIRLKYTWSIWSSKRYIAKWLADLPVVK